ncbi:Hypp5890 [Branchiostoma lanceolatum]|uniref:Hypp5890 protein n=1 Tax=Branchiostoma lanceolatum TaxID=7740 RepID=A0A8J9YS05_BRALA|nr:Hypp5890 [Branchiostoma lanceolatum]
MSAGVSRREGSVYDRDQPRSGAPGYSARGTSGGPPAPEDIYDRRMAFLCTGRRFGPHGANHSHVEPVQLHASVASPPAPGLNIPSVFKERLRKIRRDSFR